MDRQLKKTSGWIQTGIIIAISAGLILTGFLFFDAQVKALRNNHYEQLSSIAHLKIDEIVQWRSERISDIRVATESVFFQDAITNLILHPDDDALAEKVLERQRILMTHYTYTNAMVVLPDRSILVSANPLFDRLEPQAVEIVREAEEKRRRFSAISSGLKSMAGFTLISPRRLWMPAKPP